LRSPAEERSLLTKDITIDDDTDTDTDTALMLISMPTTSPFSWGDALTNIAIATLAKESQITQPR
jgi:hypothetical protein